MYNSFADTIDKEQELKWVRERCDRKMLESSIGYWETHPFEYQFLDNLKQSLVEKVRIRRLVNSNG